MKRIILFLTLTFINSQAVDCQKLEAEFAQLEKKYVNIRMLKVPTEKYDVLYRYLDKGTALMAYCRNDQRNYKYNEIVRKLRKADKERKTLHQQVIREFWKTYDVKPVIKKVYRDCYY